MRDFACPRNPSRMKSCRARIAFSMAGTTVLSKPTTPGKSGRPARLRSMRFARTSSFTERDLQPDARSAPRVAGSSVAARAVRSMAGL